jgi:rod shape determining protein RodA
MKILTHLRNLDWILISVVLLLVVFGFLSLYSSSLPGNDFSNFKKQLLFFGIGFFLMILLSYFDWRGLRDNSYLILAFYLGCLLALLGLIFWAPSIRGIKAWYKLGPFSFDPIEPLKLALIILLAKYFSMRHVEMYRIRHILLSGLYVVLPAALIFRQPDMGSVLILIILWTGILVISGIKLRHFLILVLIFLMLSVSSWFFLLKDYQKARIVSFVQPNFQPLGVGWNQNQAKIAVGAGGLFGQGFGKGSQTQYSFLPETQTDFTFATIAEEFGLVGILILFFLFCILLWRIMRIAFFAPDNFSRLFASGFSLVLISEIFIHAGMNLGMLPIIGIPLPLLSYGGSNLITTFIGLGLLESIKTH